VRTKDLFWSQKTAKWGFRWVEWLVSPKLFGPKKFQFAYVALAALLGVLGCSADAAAATTTIWPSTAVPAVVDAGKDIPIELGLSFKSDVSGTVTGVRFYKSSANTGTHVGNLWSGTGTLLASATFTSETASGWQQVNFSSPVTITANTVYVVSYHCNGGHYSVNGAAFAKSGFDSAPLHALANSSGTPDGPFTYGASSQFPKSTYNASNYWVDVVFNPNSGSSVAPSAQL